MKLGVVLLGFLKLWLAVSVRKLKKGARIPSIILSALGLLGLPIGTLISAYYLYLLCSEKGSMVFSDYYQQVIAETPEIKYRTSLFVWIILAMLIAFFVFMFFTV